MKIDIKVISVIFVLLFMGIIFFWGLSWEHPKEDRDDLILEKINQLELKIDEISNKKDSIRIVIDSTNTKIINNEKHYKEVVNNIISQSSYMDSLFITEYIDRFIKEKGSNYNLR